MKPSELYNMPAITTSKNIHLLDGHMSNIDFYNICAEASKRVELRFYADVDFDGRRVWVLFSVWFDGKPVMICQEAGREGSDHRATFVTDLETYKALSAYIVTLYDNEEDDDDDSFDPNDDIPDLTEFYNRNLSEFYDPKGVNPKYKVNDIVMAKVPKNHLVYDKKFIITRVKIKRVMPFNPAETYYGIQLDRACDPDDMGNYIDKPNEGNIGAFINDKDIVELIKGK